MSVVEFVVLMVLGLKLVTRAEAARRGSRGGGPFLAEPLRIVGDGLPVKRLRRATH